jgi:elongation factor 1-beta
LGVDSVVFCLLECSLCFCSDEISKDDIKVFAAVPTKPGAEFPNAARWYDTVAAATAAR